MSNTTAGHITGTLSLTIDGADPIDIGKIALPLIVTRLDDQRTGRMAFGLGVDLDAVRRDVAELFRQAETGADDD